MSKHHIIAVDVYLERRKSREYVGTLCREGDFFFFKYYEPYAYGNKPLSLGPDLSLSQVEHRSQTLFPSFEDRIPSRKNPAYSEYCQDMGISPEEKDPLVLLGTIARRGPSSFIFVPVLEESFTKEDVIEFRRDLRLSIRDFASLFDFAPATIQRIEKGQTSGKDSLKRIELYYRFPEVALFELERSGFKIHEDKREYVESVLRSKKEHRQKQSGQTF